MSFISLSLTWALLQQPIPLACKTMSWKSKQVKRLFQGPLGGAISLLFKV